MEKPSVMVGENITDPRHSNTDLFHYAGILQFSGQSCWAKRKATVVMREPSEAISWDGLLFSCPQNSTNYSHSISGIKSEWKEEAIPELCKLLLVSAFLEIQSDATRRPGMSSHAEPPPQLSVGKKEGRWFISVFNVVFRTSRLEMAFTCACNQRVWLYPTECLHTWLYK